MAERSVEKIIKGAQTGYLTKDEYRDFQKKLKSDRFFAERSSQILSMEDLHSEENTVFLPDTESPLD